jgi:hypothetical protein
MLSHGPGRVLAFWPSSVDAVDADDDRRSRGGVCARGGSGRSERDATRSRDTRDVRGGLRAVAVWEVFADVVEEEEGEEVERLDEERFSDRADPGGADECEWVASWRIRRSCWRLF